nr:MAG TPA: hypothetical protein [Caudoviricetes sp.]DAM76142.1 MAG TPA: hypothetical protein [Caudoviricetes sp.]
MLKPQIDGFVGDESLSDFIISFATGDAKLKHSLVTFLLGDQRLDLVRGRELWSHSIGSTLIGRGFAVEHLLHLLELLFFDSRGSDDDVCRRSLTGDVRLLGAELPRQRGGLGALVQRLIVGAGRRGLTTVGDVNLFAEVIAIDVGGDFGSPTKSELTAGLLGNSNTGSNLGFAVADVEFLRGLEGFDGTFEFLGRNHDSIYTVIRVLLSSLAPLWRLADLSEAVPRHTFAIVASVVHYEQNAAVNTTLVQAFAVLIPYQSVFRHFGLLSLVVNCEHVVIEVVHSIVPVHSTPWNTKNLLRKLTVGLSVDRHHLILSMRDIRAVVRVVNVVVDFGIYDARILKLDRWRGLIVHFRRTGNRF